MSKYSDSYVELLFERWYSLGGPEYKAFFKGDIPADEFGRIPSYEAIQNFARDYRWQERKDELNGRAVMKAEEAMVERQFQMWKEHADAAAEVRREALAYIKEHGFDTSASAVQAIKWAQEEERRTRGVEEFYKTVKDKSNDQLLDMIRALAERQLSGDEIIEVVDEKESAEPNN